MALIILPVIDTESIGWAFNSPTNAEARVLVRASVTTTSTLGSGVQLIGDVDIPGASMAYSTDTLGNKGWHTIAGGGGVTGLQVQGNPLLTGDVTLIQGSNVTLTQSGQNITIASGGGGGGGTTFYFRFAQLSLGLGGNRTQGGNFTLGQCIFVNQDCTITAVEFAWDGSANKTIKISLWDAGTDRAGTTLLDSGTVNVTTAGLYTFTFGSPISLTSGHWYFIGSWETGGSIFIQNNAAVFNAALFFNTTGCVVGPYAIYSISCANGGGDSIPNADFNSGSGANAAPLNPVLQ